MGRAKNWNKILGPGILFAATAIGVSHLVQSTKAGSLFGFSLVGFVIAANVLKFPFFEFGTRYAAATGKSLIQGYAEKSKWWLYVYLLITIPSMFFVTAAVGVVTEGFMENLLGLSSLTNIPRFTLYFLFSLCVLILLKGKFNSLEKITKVLGLALLISSLLTFFSSLWNIKEVEVSYFPSLDKNAWAFLIPLMGWMPTAIDLSTWNSTWTVEKIKQSGYHPTVKESSKEFQIGYWISAFLAVLFLSIGALLVFGSDKVVPQGGVAFSGFIVELFKEGIGTWAGTFISIAAFSIMFSTFITVLDGFSRNFTLASQLAIPAISKNTWYEKFVLFLVAIGGISLILSFSNNPNGFSALVNTATSVSFLLAPFIAVFNFKLVQPSSIGEKNSPSRGMNLLAILGLLYLVGFSLWFLWDLI